MTTNDYTIPVKRSAISSIRERILTNIGHAFDTNCFVEFEEIDSRKALKVNKYDGAREFQRS